jgi:hypothetical protein
VCAIHQKEGLGSSDVTDTDVESLACGPARCRSPHVSHLHVRLPNFRGAASQKEWFDRSQLLCMGTGSSDFTKPDFGSLTGGSHMWWVPLVSDPKSGKVREHNVRGSGSLCMELAGNVGPSFFLQKITFSLSIFCHGCP